MDSNYEPYWSDYLQQFDLPSEYFQHVPSRLQTNKFCVIVEPRISKTLILVIKNFLHVLKERNWGMIVFHGTDNESFLKTELQGIPNIIMVKLEVDNITAEQYSDLLCSKAFWNTLLSLGCERSLIFQTDTLLFKDTVDDFLEYDYVGAGWCVKWLGILEVGNGGLSMRNVRTMLEITEKCPRSISSGFNNIHLQNEDIYFAFWLLKLNKKIPTKEDSCKFSVETVYYEDPCGFHKPHLDKFPSKEEYIRILSKRFDMPSFGNA